MSERRTDDGTYPNVEEELAKIDERAAAGDELPTGPYHAVAEAERAARAREPLDADRDDASAPDAGDGDGDGEHDEDDVMRRAEVLVAAEACSDEEATHISLAVEHFADGDVDLVIGAVDKERTEVELARVDAGSFFAAIDRLRAFSVDPNPSRERNAGDVHAALEQLIADAGPAMLRALGVPPSPPRGGGKPPLRPVPGGRK